MTLDGNLFKAADVIREGGLVKDTLCRGEAHCALGAYVVARGKDVNADFASSTSSVQVWTADDLEASKDMSVLADVIRELFPKRVQKGESDTSTVYRFNDHRDTTEDDVVRVFRVAGVQLASA